MKGKTLSKSSPLVRAVKSERGVHLSHCKCLVIIFLFLVFPSPSLISCLFHPRIPLSLAFLSKASSPSSTSACTKCITDVPDESNSILFFSSFLKQTLASWIFLPARTNSLSLSLMNGSKGRKDLTANIAITSEFTGDTREEQVTENWEER